MTRQANALLVIIVAFLLAHFSRFGYTALQDHYLIALLVVIVVSSIVLPATGAFRQEFEWAVIRRLRRLIAGWAIVLLVLISLAAMLKTTDYYSRIWFGLWVIYGTIGLSLTLLIAHWSAVRRREKNREIHRVALIGSGQAAARLEQRMQTDPTSEMKVVARFGQPWSDQSVMRLDQIASYLEENGIQEVWIAADWEDKALLQDSLEALRESVVDVNVVPDFDQYRLLNQSITEWGGLPVINLAGTPMTDSERRIKSVFDRLGAIVLIVLLSPFMLLLALVIRLESRGPALFRQKRQGMGGEVIEVFKFRTMVQHTEPQGTLSYASKDDPRVTRIGRLLRRSSIDELPQLFNVLKGEMSLVGPRPQPPEHNQLYQSHIPRYVLRHKVKPGMTGWAQVNGLRGEVVDQQQMVLRIEHDLWYIQNWSLWLDLKILLLTPFAMFHRNAY
jgi:putative colanic acid biosynthesis UDP-glucose lipid carrier transferase